MTGSDGNYYVSIQASNTGNDPTSSAAYWTEIKFIRVWNTNETYVVDDVVLVAAGRIHCRIEYGQYTDFKPNQVATCHRW